MCRDCCGGSSVCAEACCERSMLNIHRRCSLLDEALPAALTFVPVFDYSSTNALKVSIWERKAFVSSDNSRNWPLMSEYSLACSSSR